MLSFPITWSLFSSLCYAIATSFAREIIVSKLPSRIAKIVFRLIITVYWILLGLLQWKLLDVHLSDADIWGLTTIISGTFCSILSAAGFYLASYFIFRTFSPVGLGFGTNKSKESEFDFLFALCAIVITLFSAGFIFGFAQKSVLQRSVFLSYLNYIPFISGFLWLLILPVFSFLFLLFAKHNFYFYVYLLVTAICTFIVNLLEGLIIQNTLNIL